MWKNGWLIVVSACMLLACKKEQPPVSEPEPVNQLRMEVHPMFGNEVLYLDSMYAFPNGDRIQFTDVLFYTTDWKNGSSLLLDAALFDYRSHGNFLFQVPGVPADFSALTSNLGVDAARNHADPTALPTTHPLNIVQANGMHWGWNPGYIFTKLEARMDTIADGVDQFDHLLVYHTGMDELLTNLTFDTLTWKPLEESVFGARLKLDLRQFFLYPGNEISPRSEFITHSSPGQMVLSSKVIANFKSALSVIP